MTYRVTLAKSNRSFTVHPGETILDAALAHGILLPYDCRAAECRTCRTRILSGTVAHILEEKDIALTPGEIQRGYRLLCSAVAHSDVELDT